MINYFQGHDGFVWFTGVVEDRNDPTKLGRVRVRCVGYHTDDKTKIPTEDLPWAWVLQTVHTPSMNGMGHTPGFLVEGTWVVGFFRDPEMLQEPIILGSLPGVPENLGDPNKGFHDPNRRESNPELSGYNTSVYPRTTGEPDTNRLARNFEVQDTIVGDKKAGVIEGIRSADGTTFDEPMTTYNAVYPKNHVFESEVGHTTEFDDTSGAERVSQYAHSGTFYEIDAVGNRVDKVISNDYHLVKGDNFEHVQGDMHLTVEGTLNIKCKKLNVEVLEDYNEDVGQNKTIRIEGTLSNDINGDVLETFNASYTQSIHGNIDLRYGAEDGTFSEHIKSDITRNYSASVKEFLKETYEQHITESSKIFIKTDFEQHVTGNSQILVKGTYDLDSTGAMTIDGTTVNINQGTNAATRIGDSTTHVDAAHGAHGSTVTGSVTGGSGSVKIGDTAVKVDPTESEEVTETDLVDIILPEILTSEPKSSTVGGAGDDDPQEVDDNGVSRSLSPTAGRSNGAVSAGSSNAESGSIGEDAITEPGDCTRPDLGSMSERYESNGRPDAINTRSYKDDRGGWSYGSYQIATKTGTFKSWMNFLQKESNGYTDFYASLNNLGGDAAARRGDVAFRNKWKELANSQITATRFKQAQHDFIQRTHHDEAVRNIKRDTGIDVCDGTHSNGLQDTVWSTAVQYGPGGARKIFREAHTNLKNRGITNPTDEDLITEIHDIKLNTIPVRFRSSPNLHAGLRKRFTSEKQTALANNIAPVTQVASTSTGSGGGQVV